MYLVQVIQTLPNNLDGFLEIILRNDQRWSKADTKIAISLDPNTLCSHLHVNMCWLGQQTSTLQQQAELPSRHPFQALRLVDDHSIQEATPSDGLDQWRVNGFNGRPENLAKAFSTGCKVFINEDLQCSDSRSTNKWISR